MSNKINSSDDTGSVPKDYPGRKKALILFGALVLVAAAVFGGRYYLHFISHESTEDAFVEAHVVSISPRVSGHVARVLVTDNQKVEEGELLAEVDAEDYKVARDIALAHKASAQASREEALAGVEINRSKVAEQKASLNSQLAALAQARSEVNEVSANADRDTLDLNRIKKLASAGAVSKQEFDHARTSSSVSRARLNSARERVEAQTALIEQAEASVLSAENELKQAEALVGIRSAELQEAEAEVERARLNLSYTRITAPCDGFVTKKGVEPGAFVQVGQRLFNIVSRDAWVVANFKETQIADMHPGQSVEIEVDTYPDVVFKGKVDSIQRGTGSRFTLLPPENAAGNFIKVVQRVPVKIILCDSGPGKEYFLAPGMSVIPSVNIREPGSGVLCAELDSGRKADE